MWCARWHRRNCRGRMTTSRRRPIHNPPCLPASTGSTASPASSRAPAIRVNLATSSTETGAPDAGHGDDTMTSKTHLDRLKTLRSLSALLALSAALGACTIYGGEVVTASVPPNDYRQRHPIAVQEANRSIV